MFKDIPEAEFIMNKTTNTIEATIDFNAALFTKSLEYFNEVTDKKFYSATVQIADSINNITDYAKENIKTSTNTLRSLFGNTK
jgi:hypothetical protein